MEACEPSCHIESRGSACGYCACKSCDFCRRGASDAHAVWAPLPTADARIISPTEMELTDLRCPPPGGCRFRVRPTNVDGWSDWSLGSDAALTTQLPPRDIHAVRLELRLVSPFTQDAGLLEEVLLRDLAKALRVPTQQGIRLVETRLNAEYATIDLMPPDAFATAAKLHRLVETPHSIVHDGQASRSIDGGYGLVLIHRDGQAEQFAPPDGRDFPTIESALEHMEASVERTFGLSPRYTSFWQIAGGAAIVLCGILCCCVVALRRACGAGSPRYRYSRTLADEEDEVASWAYADSYDEPLDDYNSNPPSSHNGRNGLPTLTEFDEEYDEDELEEDFRPNYRVLTHQQAGGGQSSALAALGHATNGGSLGASSAVQELQRAAMAAGVAPPVDWGAAVQSAAHKMEKKEPVCRF